MSSVYTLVVGDLEPDMEIDVSGQLPLLQGATALTLEWHKPDSTVVQVPLVAVDLTIGAVKRVWVSGDSALPGIHKGRVIITCANGEPLHYPNDGTFLYWIVSI